MDKQTITQSINGQMNRWTSCRLEPERGLFSTRMASNEKIGVDPTVGEYLRHLGTRHVDAQCKTTGQHIE